MKLEEKNGLRILTADEGKYLVRKDSPQSPSKVYYLGVNDKAENFSEISEEKALAILNPPEEEETEEDGLD